MKNSYSFVEGTRSLPDYKAFDPYEDLCQFMEEAKQHAHEAGSRLLQPETETLAANQMHMKGKKSWKAASVFSWLRKAKPRSKPSNPAVLKSKNVSISVPVCSSDNVNPKRKLSGPPNGLFTPLRKVDTAAQYASLPKLNSKSSKGPYGPLYTP